MDDFNEKPEELFQDKVASCDENLNSAVSLSTLMEGGDSKEKSKNKKKLISASNSSKEDGIMSSKVQKKAKAARKGPVKKKTTVAASTKNKTQSKLKLNDVVKEGDSGGSSSDEKFLEEFESDGSDFSSSTDSDDLSQEFSDEDRLMEYYEKKLREHAIVGNFGFNSDFSEDSEPSQELKNLVDETFKFKPRPPGKQDQANESTTSLAKKAVKLNKREQAKSTKPSGKLQLTKGITTAQKFPNTMEVNMKSVISGLKSEKGATETGSVPKNVPLSKRANPANRIPVNNTPVSFEDRRTAIAARQKRNLLNSLDLTKPGSNRTRSQALSPISSPQQNFERAQPNAHMGASENPDGSYQKVVDYLARITHVQNSISEINQKINGDAEDSAGLEILQSARAAILEQRDRNKKSTQFSHKRKDVATSAPGSTAASEIESAFSEKHPEDEVVDRILNATLGVS